MPCELLRLFSWQKLYRLNFMPNTYRVVSNKIDGNVFQYFNDQYIILTTILINYLARLFAK